MFNFDISMVTFVVLVNHLTFGLISEGLPTLGDVLTKH